MDINVYIILSGDSGSIISGNKINLNLRKIIMDKYRYTYR